MSGKTSRRSFLNLLTAASIPYIGISRNARAQQGPEVINLGLSHYINQATIFIAQETGLFQKMRLDIRMKTFMDGALIVAPMLSGEVSLGVMTCSAGLFNSFYRGGAYRAFLCNGQG